MIRWNAIFLILIINLVCGMCRSLSADMKIKSSENQTVANDEIVPEGDDDPSLTGLIDLVFTEARSLIDDMKTESSNSQDMDHVVELGVNASSEDKTVATRTFFEGPTPSTSTNETTTEPSDFRLAGACLKACAG
ncbi:uncharacterized protein LOC132791542 [Drosophila nasuta]|uniref:uncharacterized protein LOC132791542 n=1 Tax=Drosophila nasuta TaxID=42062 RepID=UPI00295F18AA|nr:uncharacterized protein LOC132791542 [Drosophila nasuta]